MAVECSGDCRLMEQVGEKQDFESALTHLGVPHEAFALRVQRAHDATRDDAWNQDYIVTVIAVATGCRQRYTGGPRHDWIRRFKADLATSAYGVAPAFDVRFDDGAPVSSRAARGGPSAFQHRTH